MNKASEAWDAYIKALYDHSVPFTVVQELKENYKNLSQKVCFCGTKLPENHPIDICYTCVNEANSPNYDYYYDFNQ